MADLEGRAEAPAGPAQADHHAVVGDAAVLEVGHRGVAARVDGQDRAIEARAVGDACAARRRTRWSSRTRPAGGYGRRWPGRSPGRSAQRRASGRSRRSRRCWTALLVQARTSRRAARARRGSSRCARLLRSRPATSTRPARCRRPRRSRRPDRQTGAARTCSAWPTRADRPRPRRVARAPPARQLRRDGDPCCLNDQHAVVVAERYPCLQRLNGGQHAVRHNRHAAPCPPHTS